MLSDIRTSEQRTIVRIHSYEVPRIVKFIDTETETGGWRSQCLMSEEVVWFPGMEELVFNNVGR